MTGTMATTTHLRGNSSLRDLLIRVYNLAPIDIDLLTILARDRTAMTLEELTVLQNRDKSTVFRSLKKLISVGLCCRETRTIRQGAHFHLYTILPLEILKIETEKRVAELEQSLRRILNGFEKDIEEMSEIRSW